MTGERDRGPDQAESDSTLPSDSRGGVPLIDAFLLAGIGVVIGFYELGIRGAFVTMFKEVGVTMPTLTQLVIRPGVSLVVFAPALALVGLAAASSDRQAASGWRLLGIAATALSLFGLATLLMQPLNDLLQKL